MDQIGNVNVGSGRWSPYAERLQLPYVWEGTRPWLAPTTVTKGRIESGQSVALTTSLGECVQSRGP